MASLRLLLRSQCRQASQRLQVKQQACLLSTADSPKEKPTKTFDDIPGANAFKLVFDQMANGWRHDKKSADYAKAYYDMFNSFCEMGDVIKIDIPFKDPFVFVFKPELIETFFRASEPDPRRPGFLALKYKRDLDAKNGGLQKKGLLTTNGQEWFDFRKKVQQPMLKPKATHRYTPLLDGIAQNFIDDMVRPRLDPVTKQTPDDFITDLYKWALESVTLLALNTRLGCLDPNLPADSEPLQMINAVQNMFRLTRDLEDGMSLWQFMPQFSKTYRGFSNDCDTFIKVSQKHIHKSLADSKNRDPEEDPPMLVLFAERGCDEETAVVMAMDMLFAGIDTSSNTTAFTFYQLAKHPEVQEKLYQEIKSFLPNKDSVLDNAKLEKMSYLRAVLKETLRLHSPAIGTARELEGPLQLGEYYIDRKCVYFGPNLFMCRSERYFKNALEFRPERWLRDHPLKEDIHPFLMLPFGHGKRMCVGRRFAEQEARILILKMIQNFRIEWHHPDLENSLEALVKPASPVRLTLIER